MPTLSKTHLAVIALFFLSLIWGYNWVVMKEVMRYVDPFDFSALRTLFGSIVLFIVIILRRRSLRIRAFGPTLLLGLLQTGLFTAMIQWALVQGGAGKTAVLVYTMPFWLLPLSLFFLKETVTRMQWIAITVALGGLLMIIEPWRTQPDAFSTFLGLSAALIWAISAVVAKKMRIGEGVDLLSLTAWQMLLGAIALCILAGILPSEPPQLTPYFYGALAYNAILATGLAWLLWLFILGHLPAGLAGLSTLLVPAVGVLSGWIELGERPSGAEGLGMLCTVTALGLISYSSYKARANRRDTK